MNTPVKKRRRRSDSCSSCGSTDLVETIDNHGLKYMGCARCVIRLPPPMVPTVGQAGKYVPIDTLRQIRNTLAELVRQAEVAGVDLPGELIEPFDGGGKVRPHSIPGWWQVWSGGLCIALLADKDVEPIRAPLPIGKDRT